MDPESMQQLQNEFRRVMEELQLRVTELRDLRAQLEQERTQFGVSLAETNAETKAQMTKIEQRISELQEQQKEIALKVNMPRLSTEEVETLSANKRMKAFLKFCRQAAGVSGARLTAEERATLYPDGRNYAVAGEPGTPWMVKTPEEARALVEDATGQILVPESFDAAIIRAVEDTAVIRPLATVRPITSNRERYRKITECTFAYGKALELGGEATESDPTPDEAWQYIEDAYGLIYLGVNELQDSDYDLVTYIQDSMARAWRDTDDEMHLNGAGHASLQPQGLLSGATITRIIAAAADAIDFDDVMDLMYGHEDEDSEVLKGVYRRNGSFLMHSFTELACMKLKDGDEQYIWAPAITAGAPNVIRGRSVYTHDDFDGIASGNDVMLFGDIRSCYRILDREGMTMQRLVEIKALAGLVGFLFKIRSTGGIIRAEACRILQMA